MFVWKKRMSCGWNECCFHKPEDNFCGKSLNILLNFRKKIYKKLVFQKTSDFSKDSNRHADGNNYKQA